LLDKNSPIPIERSRVFTTARDNQTRVEIDCCRGESRRYSENEPLGKLDSLTRITMQAEIASLWQRSGFTTLLVTHDVEEAVFLANRVIVFSDRPARIKADIAVDRPYPRHRGDPKLAELRHDILGLLGLDATW